MSQFNSMIKNMPLGLKLVLCVLFIILLTLMIWALCIEGKDIDKQIVINNYHSVDSSLVERLECTRDSIQVLNRELLEVQNKVTSLQEELTNLKKSKQISSMINHTQPVLKSKKIMIGSDEFE